MTEILKQPQYAPVPVEEQIAIIYAGTSGALDKIPVDRVTEFEKAYIDHLRADYPDLLETIRAEKKWTDEIKGQFDEISAKFRAEFLA